MDQMYAQGTLGSTPNSTGKVEYPWYLDLMNIISMWSDLILDIFILLYMRENMVTAVF